MFVMNSFITIQINAREYGDNSVVNINFHDERMWFNGIDEIPFSVEDVKTVLIPQLQRIVTLSENWENLKVGEVLNNELVK